MRACLFALLAVSLLACKREPSRGASASTKDIDALWALAPAGTEFGVVASPRAFALLDGAKTRLFDNLRSAPELASLAQKLQSELDELGITDLSPAAHGVSVDKGFALFAGNTGTVIVLPVVDRDKFFKTVKNGSKGTDTDSFNGLTCKTVKGVYACAKSVSLLDGLGGNGRPDGSKLVAVRGDIEVGGTMPGPSGPIAFSVIGQLDRGAFAIRIAVKGIASVMPIRLVEGAVPRIDAGHTTGFAVMDLGSMLASVPPVPLVPGVMASELASTVAGPVTATIRAGIDTIDMRVPLSDTGPATKLIEQCDQIPPLNKLGATIVGDTCHVPVPQMMLETDAWIEGKELRLGKRGAAATPAPAKLTAIGAELAGRKWPLVFWGRGTIFASPPLPPTALGDVPEIAAGMVRVFTLFNEMGFAMRMEGDTLHAVIAVRTAYANPDDVVAKLVAIKPADILGGSAGETAKAIAAAAPDSAFAADLAAGYTGLMIPTTVIGMMAAVAVPAFMQYMQKSKVSESALQLNKLGKYLRASYAENGAVPIGSEPLTPATSCCDGPNHKCSDPAAWTTQPIWKQLDFAIDDPHLFRYDYESKDGKSFVVHAVGDLDCDGEVVTYTLTGTPDGDMLKVDIRGPEGTD